MASSGGGWVTFFKQELGRAVQYYFYLKIFLGFSLKHYTFFNPPPPPPGDTPRSSIVHV